MLKALLLVLTWERFLAFATSPLHCALFSLPTPSNFEICVGLAGGALQWSLLSPCQLSPATDALLQTEPWENAQVQSCTIIVPAPRRSPGIDNRHGFGATFLCNDVEQPSISLRLRGAWISGLTFGKFWQPAKLSCLDNEAYTMGAV